ncbi:MAG: hypothetical protein AB4041_09360 [Microcystaceae cyanobacterium]
METITPLDLSGIQSYVQNCLQQELGKQITCEVNCWVQEQILLVFIQCGQQTLALNQEIITKLRDNLSHSSSFSSYQLKVYWLVDGGVYPLNSDHALSHSFLTSSQIAQEISRKNLAYSLPKRQERNYFSKLTALGLGISLGLGLLYIFTRPCGLGSCPQLNQAQKAAEEILNRQITSETELLLSKQQLSRSIELLKSIPAWSRHYGVATALLSDYERQLLSLESLITVTQQASQSQQSITTPSQSFGAWQSSKTQLEEAINRLPSSDVPQALQISIDSKKRQYERTLATIEQRMQGEKEAATRLKQGREAAQLAHSRQGIAQSLEDWQLVEATWQTAVERLQSISPNTTSYDKARQLLKEYNYQQVKAQGKKQQVQKEFQRFKTAQEQAKQALAWQEQQQWSKTTEQWRNALTTLQQIPVSSFYAQQAKPLISSYQVALNQAEIQLKNALARQELTQYLENLCQRPEKICYYKLQNNLIKVRLTQAYHQQLIATAAQAKQDNNQQIQLHLMNHLSRLENGLRSLSLNARQTIELYHADGQLMMTFQPN